MSDYCYTHMPEFSGYCIDCDLEAKGKRIDELEASNERLRPALRSAYDEIEKLQAENESLRAALTTIAKRSE